LQEPLKSFLRQPGAEGFTIPQSWSLLGEAMAAPAAPKPGVTPARKTP